MFDKISALWNVFRQGEAVANPAAWHDANNMGVKLGLFFLAVMHAAESFGHPLPLPSDPATVDKIAVGIAAAVAWVLNCVTSPHGGILPAKSSVIAAATARPLPQLGTSAAGGLLEQPASAVVQGDPPADQSGGGVQSEVVAADAAKQQAEQTFDQRG